MALSYKDAIYPVIIRYVKGLATNYLRSGNIMSKRKAKMLFAAALVALTFAPFLTQSGGIGMI